MRIHSIAILKTNRIAESRMRLINQITDLEIINAGE